MLAAFMDHWVPSHEAISRFWATPFQTLRPLLESLLDEVGCNNFTFYTKWYSNGIRSSLPFLPNHPQAQNVLTDNDWGRQCIDFFHERGLTVGAMLQCYSFDAGVMPRDAVLGPWEGTKRATGGEHDVEIVDPTWGGYADLLEQMLTEQLDLFPGLDQFFLEFEGLGAPAGDHALRQLAPRGEAAHGQISDEIRRQWAACGTPDGPADPWLWTTPVQDALSHTLRAHLAAARDLYRTQVYPR